MVIPNIGSARQKSVKYLSQSETELFFNAVKKNPRDHLLFRWMYLYGLREGETIKLKLSDIQPDLRSPKEIFIKRLKSGIARHFPIRSEETILLKRWLRKRSQMKNADGFGNACSSIEFLYIRCDLC